MPKEEMNLKRVTIKDVAKHANVSTATVSRVVNGIGTVTDDNRKKVQESIKELNYFSNTLASNLKKNSSNVVGIVIPTFTNEFFMQVIKGIEDHFRHSEYVFYIASSDDKPEKERAILKKLLESNAEAVVLSTIGGNDQFIEELRQLNMYIISVDRYIENKDPMDYICENNQESAYQLTKEFLKEKPSNEIVVLGGHEELSIGQERLLGTKQALKEEEILFHYIDGQYSEETAKQVFLTIREDFPLGCGIISLNNTMVAGLISAMYEELSEEEMSKYPIASYGEIVFQSIFSKNIPIHIRQRPYEIGKAVADLLEKKISATNSTPQTYEIKSSLEKATLK
ncbi:LacI family transcriptional regulator [Enterococcus florum]|uniref:LacI family transcriptional regulator n=1 Tax=Enterococcus florum TaxID=2480627 RepID=A0A4P5PC72_9ENTE|nr:LacI family DNA-binding transcriptional regulator [Enterococcus florum]GCF93558.1 LacI family transcriptional regulator [Enterococcus florum]